MFIGHDLDGNGFVGRLEAALMTDIELVGGRDAARRLLDPWPRWGTDAVHEYGHESGGVGQAAA